MIAWLCSRDMPRARAIFAGSTTCDGPIIFVERLLFGLLEDDLQDCVIEWLER